MVRFDDLRNRLVDLHAAIIGARQATDATHALLQRISRERGSSRTISTVRAFRQFDKWLSEAQVRQALSYLVGLSDYRFIGIFRFMDGNGTSVVHFDKDSPTVMQAGDLLAAAVYSSHLRHSDSAFGIGDAANDVREWHPKAPYTIAAYCGIPLMTPEDVSVGTLCLYDTVPRDVDQLDLELLVQAAGALARSGKVPSGLSKAGCRP